MASLSLFAVVLIWQRKEAVALAVVFALFLWAWLWLMPKINQVRDAELNGSESGKKSFNLLHKLSVVINLAQLVTVAVVFFKLIV